MPSGADVARELYAAFDRADPGALLAVLHPGFYRIGHQERSRPA
jgi:hypothetical protein